MDESRLHAIDVCALCISGLGAECHTPGCAFWMADVPSGEVLVVLQRASHITRPDGTSNPHQFDGYPATD